MATTLEAESTLTDRYQTTVPEAIRLALRLGKRDKIRYAVRPTGEVVLSRADAREEADPVLDSFLAFLAQDMEAHPERLQGVDAALVKHIGTLVHGVEVKLDAELSPDDE
ncbi:MAG: type II toxin-antitoxin system PrlF family antitoxin [Curvibacter lanceolatus]|jgi:antitoxin PrlF|uniref:type II toxin-antitoxin system PrlF family antitoxin n=1 Tax=Curvibacter lanceolatus TaxID=86182 RepID=UPI0023577E38|nr:type II toxin-antitoxin system PrlF family antitoxin [Curvibacter lanceolatus]MBV5291565.1 type II toxin-antitoxin system PrlF family antitoxin [Curvibacter lanceolatus]